MNQRYFLIKITNASVNKTVGKSVEFQIFSICHELGEYLMKRIPHAIS